MSVVAKAGTRSRRRRGGTHLLVVGGPPDGALPRDSELREVLRGGSFCGCVVLEPAGVASAYGLPVLGSLIDIPRLVDELGVRRVALGPGLRSGRVGELLDEVGSAGAPVEMLEESYESITGRSLLGGIRGDRAAGLEASRGGLYLTYAKRIADVALTVALLPLALPLMTLGALAVKLGSRGPVLYVQGRVGEDGRAFRMPKLRTMVVDAEAGSGPVWATPEDPRVTPVGRLLRRLGLDELPQLLCVLKGEMSLIGPRPERPEFVDRLSDEVPLYRARLLVRPGITGWAQVNRGSDQSVEDVIEKLRYDLYYVRHASPALDLRVLLGTVAEVVRRVLR